MELQILDLRAKVSHNLPPLHNTANLTQGSLQSGIKVRCALIVHRATPPHIFAGILVMSCP